MRITYYDTDRLTKGGHSLNVLALAETRVGVPNRAGRDGLRPPSNSRCLSACRAEDSVCPSLALALTTSSNPSSVRF